MHVLAKQIIRLALESVVEELGQEQRGSLVLVHGEAQFVLEVLELELEVLVGGARFR